MSRRTALIHTAINSLALLLMGVTTAHKSTCFNDLLLISGTDVEGGSFYVAGSNFGYLTGTLLAGSLYDRVSNKPTVIVLAMIFAAVLTTFTSWCDTFISMLFVYSIQTIFCGVYETVVNADEVKAWDGNSDSAMQFLSFCYSLGGVFGPLIAEPFLARKKADISNETASNISSLSTSSPPLFSSTLNFIDTTIVDSPTVLACEGDQNCSGTVTYMTTTNSSLHNASRMNSNSATSVHLESRIHYSFFITGLVTLITAIPFLVLCFKSHSRSKVRGKEKGTRASEKRLPRLVYFILMTMSCVHYCFHTMAEDSFNQYLFYYLVTALDWSKTNGAWINSVSWGVSTCVKLALVVIAKRVDTGIILFLSTIGMTASSVLFIIASIFNNDVLIWISTCSFALSQSAVYAGVFSWVDATLVRLDGKETSALMVFSGLGGMIGPLILGFLMKDYPLLAFPSMILVECTIGTILFAIQLFIAKPIVNRRYGPPRRLLPQTEDGKTKVLVESQTQEPTFDTEENL